MSDRRTETAGDHMAYACAELDRRMAADPAKFAVWAPITLTLAMAEVAGRR